MKTQRSTSTKNKNVTILIATVMLLAIGAITAGVVLGSRKQGDENANQELNSLEQGSNLNVADNDTYTISGFMDLSYDNSNPQTMAEKSDGIAVVKIKSIDGVDNYGYGVQQYVHPYTYGEMEIIQTLSGDMKEGTIVKFSRLGGTMTFDEYLKGLSEVERAKFANQNAGNSKVKIAFEGDIDVESGKTYLAYLVNSTVHYAEPRAYEIIGFEGGLREVKTTSTGYSVNSNSSDLKVLNNFTSEWENLSDIVKQDK